MPAVFLKRPSSPVLAKAAHHAIFSLHPFLLVDPTDVFWCWGFLCCSSAGAGLTDILLSENRKPIRHFPTGLHGHLLAPIWLAPYGVACQAGQDGPGDCMNYEALSEQCYLSQLGAHCVVSAFTAAPVCSQGPDGGHVGISSWKPTNQRGDDWQLSVSFNKSTSSKSNSIPCT